MCVLIFKPSMKAMPSDMILDAARRRNPHGFGFCTPTKYFRSLYYSEFKRELDNVDISEPCIIHFRFATEGSIKTKNCHPFKAEVDNKQIFFAHNGVLPFHPKGDITDSQYAFETFLLPKAEKYGLWSTELHEAVNAIIGSSKFAFMKGREVVLFGDFKDMDGCKYSNLYFMPYTRSYHPLMAI